MLYNYKLEEHAITNITKRLIKLFEKQNLSSTTLNLKHQTSLLKITPTVLKYSYKPQTVDLNYTISDDD